MEESFDSICALNWGGEGSECSIQIGGSQCQRNIKEKGRSRSLLSLSSKAAYHFACLSSARGN